MAFGSISNQNVEGLSINVTPPSGIVDNDILIALSVSDSPTSTPGFPAGFTQPTGSPQSLTSFDAARFATAIKVAASESGNYTLTSTGNSIIGAVLRVSGRVATVTPHRISAAKNDTGVTNPTITSAAFGSATSTICDMIWLAIADGANGANVTFTAPSGYTLDADICQTPNFERQYAVAHKDSAASGETGVTTGSISGAISAWAVYLIALADASAPIPPFEDEWPDILFKGIRDDSVISVWG